MTPLETLKAARDLISDPARWTQKEYARDKRGESVSPESDEAVCWCVLGATQRVGNKYSTESMDAVMKLRALIPSELIADFNDTHTHAEVLALFDAAIAELEGAL